MRLATWNVNSIRTRVDRALAFLEREDIDALAMQEIKCRPDQFPVEPFEAAGYELAIHGLNQWNGVAIASRVGLDDVDTSFPGQPGWAAQPEAEEDAGILAESSAWEAATNALDAEEIQAQGGTDWGVGRGPAKGRGPRRPSSGTDWGVGRGSAKSAAARTRSPWPAAVRRQRLAGVAFALLGLVLATASAMNLARNAEAGHPWIPPWLVAVLGGAGLVAAAGYLAWAGGTPVRREAERWKPGVLDAAAGLTTGTVKVNDPDRLVARARGPLLLGSSVRGDETAPTVDSGPTPVMGTSTVDQSLHAPAGVAGAVGGFMLASAVVCAVVALILGSAWLIATAALTLGGVVAIRLAGEWLGQV